MEISSRNWQAIEQTVEATTSSTVYASRLLELENIFLLQTKILLASQKPALNVL